MRPAVTLLAFLLSASAVSAQSVDDRFWIPNDRVLTAAVVDETLFIGGVFTVVGPPTGFGAAIDVDTGDVALEWARINGVIYAVESDGGGGFFVGGAFETVDGAPRRNLVHLLPDGSVDPDWDAEANGSVRVLTRLGDVLYIGGEFTLIGITPRHRIAAVDVNGAVTAFDPGADGDVRAILAGTDRVFAGGFFSSIGGAARARLAALDPMTGDALPFDPHVSASVRAMASSGGTLYLGGAFTTVDGVPRDYLAAVDAITGDLLPWAPESNGYVHSLSVHDGAVYAGGIFYRINGQTRFGVAAIHSTSGDLLPFDAGLDVNHVSELTITGDRLWIVGTFRKVGGITRRHVAALNPDSGAALPWRSDAGNWVYALAVDDDRIYAGGIANTYGAVERESIAAFDLTTGELLDFDPGEIGRVYVIQPSDRGTIYIGGGFTEIGGAERAYLAELDPVTGAATAWDPPALVPPFFGGIAFDEDRVFVGGEFTGTQDDIGRYYLAALNRETGGLTAWHPVADLWVRDVVYHERRVYAGGHFYHVAGVPRRGLAAIDAVSGVVHDFRIEIGPPTGGHIQDLVVVGDVLYAVGQFEGFGGEPRRGGAAVDLAGQSLLPWNPDAAPIVGVSVADGVAYIGGGFTSVGGAPQKFAAAVDAWTGDLLDWDPSPEGILEGGLSVSGHADVMLAHGDHVVVAGDFVDSGGGSGHAFLAVVSGLESPTAVEGVPAPPEARLESHPNPFTPSVSLSFELPVAGVVRLTIHDVTGRRLALLADGELPASRHVVQWDGRDERGRTLPSGVYFARLTGVAGEITRALVRLQ